MGGCCSNGFTTRTRGRQRRNVNKKNPITTGVLCDSPTSVTSPATKNINSFRDLFLTLGRLLKMHGWKGGIVADGILIRFWLSV